VRPRTQDEPTAVGDILAAAPNTSRLRDEAERQERLREVVGATAYGACFYTLEETRNMASAAEEYIVDGGVLTKGGKLLLYAGAGVGKTTFLDYLGASIASGQPFLGRFAVDRARRVLFVQGELARAELASHGQQLLERFSETAAEHELIFWLQTQLKLPRDFDVVRSAVAHTRSEVVILDPFIRFFGGDNSTQPEEVNRLFESVDRLLEDPALGVVAVVIAHHMNVARIRTAGSWAFEGWPSTIVRLDSARGRPHARTVTFEKVRSPDSGLLGHQLTIVLQEDGYLAEDSDNSSTPDGRGIACLVDFLRAAGGEAWRKECVSHLIVALDVKARQTTNIITAAKNAGLIRAVEHGRQARLHLDATAAD